MKNVGIRFVLAALCILALATVGVVLRADDDDEGTILRAKLTGFQEVPAKFTAGSGTFRATLSPDGTTLSYTLSWSNLTAPPLFAHIHIGQPAVNGAVMVFLCNDPNTPRTKPNCDGATSTVTGTIRAADIGKPESGAAAQGINPGDFAGFLAVVRGHVSYANVHTPKFPGGEIRGIVRVEDRD